VGSPLGHDAFGYLGREQAKSNTSGIIFFAFSPISGPLTENPDLK